MPPKGVNDAAAEEQAAMSLFSRCAVLRASASRGLHAVGCGGATANLLPHVFGSPRQNSAAGAVRRGQHRPRDARKHPGAAPVPPRAVPCDHSLLCSVSVLVCDSPVQYETLVRALGPEASPACDVRPLRPSVSTPASRQRARVPAQPTSSSKSKVRARLCRLCLRAFTLGRTPAAPDLP